MNLHEILTEKISAWEEGLVACIFLSGAAVEDLALEPAVKKRLQKYLAVLATLPWSYAKELCYSISKAPAC